ncbi:hypothetical protein GCM10009559_30070 [Pseudonocardia zijingensis]|uniref:Uncharacterized protein n=1 Tax=Pseudonocardia zijingensis TaxID=153376 RepID=A0ABN1Q559_9PSEU
MLAGARRGEPGHPVVHDLDRMPFGGEPAPHHLRERNLVLDQQYAHPPTVSARANLRVTLLAIVVNER